MRFSSLAASLVPLAAAGGERGATAEPVAEIVTFRLVEGADPAAFVAAAEAMTPFLRRSGAVLSRTLSADEDGLWIDHVTWTSMTAALAAAQTMMAQPEAGPFMALVDPDTVEMRHAPIRLQME